MTDRGGLVCLEYPTSPADCGTANGTDVRQWTWLNNSCQQWRLVPTT
nr:RICIN domain-containing protein [Streptomyces spinoverrucosus]